MSRTLAALILLAGSLAPLSPAVAGNDAPDGSFRVVFDPSSSNNLAYVPGFVPATLYITAPGLDEVTAWEARLGIPAGWTLLETSLNPSFSIDIGTEPGNFIVGLGTCMAQGQGSYLVRLTVGYFVNPVAPESQFCLGPSTPSSVGNAGPAFVDCNDQLFVGALWDNPCDCFGAGCAVANDQCLVPTDSQSFGELKAGTTP